MAGTCGMGARQGEGQRNYSNKARLLTMSRTNTHNRQGHKKEIRIKKNQIAAELNKRSGACM